MLYPPVVSLLWEFVLGKGEKNTKIYVIVSFDKIIKMKYNIYYTDTSNRCYIKSNLNIPRSYSVSPLNFILKKINKCH